MPEVMEKSVAAVWERVGDLEARGLSIITGRNADLERQLIAKSLEAEIVKQCRGDSEKRFKDQASYEKWRLKGRENYWLVPANNDLAGLIWFGDEAYPKDVPLPRGMDAPTATYAGRLYEGYAGTGLLTPFMGATIKAFAARKRAAGKPVPHIWIQTNSDNEFALNGYLGFGYKEVHRAPFTDERRPNEALERVTLVLPAERIAALAGHTALRSE